MGGCDCQFSGKNEKSAVNFNIFIYFLNFKEIKKKKRKKGNCFLRNTRSRVINDSAGEIREERKKNGVKLNTENLEKF